MTSLNWKQDRLMLNDEYTFTERQFFLFRACIDSWGSKIFWAFMYMQVFLFDAASVDGIGHELDTQPAQYEITFMAAGIIKQFQFK
ncbi:hypothetical protein [Lawsonibacter faecis]|uniref:Uncharacterized protein n=1 Tax=Lawsonibacter faecis TaxID=2763052 RepID=A0A8J6MGW8_9FIRM|nr:MULTISPECIES: hypothetical protein [Oscillospiraceae]KAB4834903.1 hypothetical protein GAG88_27585 [Bacteroides thetaiotaomicron]MTQ98334.1 hypothetical protein [Pseudoflavonifractor sp. BIOML-A16]MTR07682.1 hypothetical protein [Pseudoflavonifractor sp. BIOML-A15]MTR33833.1 hypothetical protein [Pseudoflavonifractor sp. BIOML-A14]MTR36736.1 hypothetical protein [Pseudoflavonifractor sp. BIOML-A9]MTR73918.1 hypothetical protein [Pseudoflavonifractor sp. BIOML-A18]MTS64693.1 hypothetical p